MNPLRCKAFRASPLAASLALALLASATCALPQRIDWRDMDFRDLARFFPKEEFVREIKMTAKKYEFDPSEVHVKKGEKVKLLITALDRTHGFQIKSLGINTRLEKGKETAVEFTAPDKGEYEFKCSVRCGLGHGRMKGKLVVE